MAETVTSLRSAVRRGNLPPDVIAELVSLPAAPDAFVSCVLLDVVSAIHEEAYNSCCALPLVFAEAHRVDEYCCSKDAFAAGDKEWEEPWCGFDVCKTCTYPPIYADCDSVSSDVRRRGAYTVAAALGSEGACEEWHCLGRCCDGEALLARVTALLAHPRINPAALDSSVLLAAVKSGVASPEVVIALLKDGRADPRKQPTLLEEACGQRAPCAATVAALLADPRVVVTDGALAAAAKGHAKVDLLDLFLRTGCGSSTLLVPAAPESSLPLPEQASSVSIRGALESAARAGRDSALHRLLGATCLLPGHATRRAIPLSVQSPADILAALCVAATSGHADCVATLLRAGCRLSSGGRLLFSAGAALQATFSPAPWGYSGPSASCTAGVVEALVRPCTREGADGICPGPHCSPADVVASLRLAAVRGGCASAVRALLAADPRPFDLSPTGPGGTASQSPLTMAAGAGETMLVLVLLGDQRCGSSPDELREAVAAAARGGHADTLQALLVAQLPSAPPPLALLPPPPPPSSAALCDVALCAAIDASHEAAVRAAFAIFRGWGAPPGTVCAAAALRVCDTGASPGCFAAVVTAAGVAGVPAIIATLAADDSAALRRLCASPTAHPELVAAVLRLGGGAVDATARNYEALRAAAHACNAGVVSVLISYSRFAAAAAAGAGVAAAAEALLGAASQEGCEGVVWLLAPRTAESETLLRAAEACARRGDAAALRAALAHVRRGDSSGTDDAASLVSRVRALSLLPVVSTATTGSGTPSSRRRAAVSRVVDAWLSAPGPSAL